MAVIVVAIPVIPVPIVVPAMIVFDSSAMLSEWADRVILIPTDKVKATSMFHPLLTSFHVLLCAVRDRDDSDANRRTEGFEG